MEEGQEGLETTEGQADSEPDGNRIDAPAPEGSDEQPATGTIQAEPQEPTFFDPKSLPDDLQPGWKQLQASYTKKMQGLSADKHKVEAFDAFNADPTGQLQKYAKQFGYQLVPAAQAPQQEQQGNESWEPQSWDEVTQRAEDRAYNRIRQDLGPMVSELQGMKKAGIERELADIDPTWQQYEDEMKQNMSAHPTLANDAALLYKMSVPDEVQQSRATQAALAKLEAKGKAAQVSGASTTTKHPSAGLTDKVESFDDAVKAAKKKLAADGITPLGG